MGSLVAQVAEGLLDKTNKRMGDTEEQNRKAEKSANGGIGMFENFIKGLIETGTRAGLKACPRRFLPICRDCAQTARRGQYGELNS